MGRLSYVVLAFIGYITLVVSIDACIFIDSARSENVKTIEFGRVTTRPDHTLLDIIKERRTHRQEKIKAIEKKWWEATPRNDIERKIFKLVKEEKAVLKQLIIIENRLKNTQLNEQEIIMLNNRYQMLRDEWKAKKETSVQTMERYGYICPHH